MAGHLVEDLTAILAGTAGEHADIGVLIADEHARFALYQQAFSQVALDDDLWLLEAVLRDPDPVTHHGRTKRIRATAARRAGLNPTPGRPDPNSRSTA